MALAFIVAGVGLASLALTWWLSRPDAPIRILDHPNERSLHAAPIPRTGGLAICGALVAGWTASSVLFQSQILPGQVLLGTVLIAAIAVLDDRFGLPQSIRLFVQFIAALVLIYGGFVLQGDWLPGVSSPDEPVVVLAGTVLLTLWLTNLYNFMDGMDGFAAGMAVIGFGALALLGWGQGDALFAGAALTISAAAAGFLWFNFPPARIFMGDSGSTTLGFLVAAFAIWAGRREVAPVWLVLVVFSPFVVDATVTLLKRAARGEPVWKAHRRHYYQRLVQLGWGHRRTVLAEYAAMLVCATAALSVSAAGPGVQWTMITVLAAVYGYAAYAIHTLEKKSNAKICS